jgi:hypothetical protein
MILWSIQPEAAVWHLERIAVLREAEDRLETGTSHTALRDGQFDDIETGERIAPGGGAGLRGQQFLLNRMMQRLQVRERQPAQVSA